MNPALPIALSASIPLKIADINLRGGPTKQDFDRARSFADVLATQGDVLMFGGKKGEAAKLFNELAFACAVCAFIPGGITIFGDHYEHKLSNGLDIWIDQIELITALMEWLK